MRGPTVQSLHTHSSLGTKRLVEDFALQIEDHLRSVESAPARACAHRIASHRIASHRIACVCASQWCMSVSESVRARAAATACACVRERAHVCTRLCVRVRVSVRARVPVSVCVRACTCVCAPVCVCVRAVVTCGAQRTVAARVGLHCAAGMCSRMSGRTSRFRQSRVSLRTSGRPLPLSSPSALLPLPPHPQRRVSMPCASSASARGQALRAVDFGRFSLRTARWAARAAALTVVQTMGTTAFCMSGGGSLGAPQTQQTRRTACNMQRVPCCVQH